MTCYKDRTYCNARCSKTDCKDALTKQVIVNTKEWGGVDVSILVKDFSQSCFEYEPAEKTHLMRDLDEGV